MLKTFTSILIFSSALGAQQPVQGVSPNWDIRQDMTALAGKIRELKTMMDKVKPEDWVKQGAPPAYVKQMATLQSGMQYLISSTEQVARDPERLTNALDAYFRMQSVEVLVNSLREGLRKYQSPDLARMINEVMVENANNREKLRTHIVDLAAMREQEFQVIDQEAQRCRSAILRTPVAAPVSDKRKKAELK